MQQDASQNPRYSVYTGAKDQDYSINRRPRGQTILILDPRTVCERCLLFEIEILENKKKTTYAKDVQND